MSYLLSWKLDLATSEMVKMCKFVGVWKVMYKLVGYKNIG